MATDIFSTNDSVFFVGGTGTKAGDNLCGGCTKDWYDANFTELSDIMGLDGYMLIAEFGATPLSTTTLGIGQGEIGMVAYLSGTNVATGRYEIVDIVDNHLVFPADTFVEGGGWVGDVVCNIGGAFETLQDASDLTDAANYNVEIYDNKAETLAGQIALDTGCGSVANNTQKSIIGFNTLPGDMDYGGIYYQSPMDALIDGVDTNKCVSLDADGGAFDVMVIANCDGIILANLYLHNTSKAAGTDCLVASATPQNTTIVNCKFDDAYASFSAVSWGHGFIVIDCYFGNGFAYNKHSLLSAPGGIFDGCVFNGDGTSYCFYGNTNVSFHNCLFYKGTYGLYVMYPVGIFNCIFYGQTGASLVLDQATYGSVHGNSNIFNPAAAADLVALALAAEGSISPAALTNSCVYAIAGAVLTHHISVNGIFRELPDAINEDPLFVDAANGDFRLLPNSPCLNTGKETIGGGYASIGAWQRKSYLGID